METLCDAVDIIHSHVTTRKNGIMVMEAKYDDENKCEVSAEIGGDVLLEEPAAPDVMIKEELIETETDDGSQSSIYEVQTTDGEIQQIVRYIQVESADMDGQVKVQANEYQTALEGEDFEVCEINMSDLKNLTDFPDGTQILQVLYVPQDLNSSSGTLGEESLKCLICNKSFTSVDLLKKHMNEHNPRPHFRELRAIMTQTDESLLEGTTPSVAGPTVQLQENESVITVRPVNPINTVNSGSILKRVNPVTDNSKPLLILKNPRKVSSKTNNTCQVCFKTFVSASKLVRHSYLHTGEKPFGCDICNRRFTQIAHLKVHMELHTGQYVYRKLFQCPHCGKKFSSKSNIQTHMIIHSGVKAYKCNQCGKSFSLASHLKRHEFSHTGQKPFTCSICSKSFTTKFSMLIHSRQHTGERPYSCKTCMKTFYDNTHLKRHMKSHKKLFKCSKCPSRFISILRLNAHLKSHSTVSPNNIQTAEDVAKLVESIRKPIPKPAVPKVRKYRTPQTLSPSLPVVRLPPDEPESAMDDFTWSMLTGENSTQQDAGHSYSLKSKNGDSKGHDVKNKCYLCNKGFAHPSNLLKHKKTVHSSLRAYKCDICQRSFTQNAHLKVHKKTLHPEPGDKTLYQCGVCFRQFNVQKNAERHMKQIHLGQETKKYLKCTVCEKAFAYPVQLKRHLKQHEDETSRECDQCGKKFISLWHYKMHYRTHTGEKPYECDKCEAKFGDQSTLTRHKRSTHENQARETCGICNKTFSSKGHLVKHFKRHPETRQAVLMAQGNKKDTKPAAAAAAVGQKYQCGECQEEFSSFTSALAHMKVHSENGEVPLKCPFCGEEDFSDMNSMKKHIRKHTGEPEPEKSQVCNFCDKRFFKKKTLKSHLETMHSYGDNYTPAMKIKVEPGLQSESLEDQTNSLADIATPEVSEVVEGTLIALDNHIGDGDGDRKEVTLQVLKQEQGIEDDTITVVVMNSPDDVEIQQEEIIKQETLEHEAAKVLYALTDPKAHIELDRSVIGEAQHAIEIKELGPNISNEVV